MPDVSALEEDLSWDQPPLQLYVGKRGKADPSQSGTLDLRVPLGEGDGEYFHREFSRYFTKRTAAQANQLFRQLRLVWSHHRTNHISIDFGHDIDAPPISFLRTGAAEAAFRAGAVEFNLKVVPTRTQSPPAGAPAANSGEQKLMAAIRLTVARAYRLGLPNDGDLASAADVAEGQLRRTIESLLRPIGRHFGLNASHYRQAEQEETPTFETSENGAESAIAELFPLMAPGIVLEGLQRAGRELRAGSRDRVLTEELAQIEALVFLRRAAHLQELAFRSLLQSHQKLKEKNKARPGYDPRMTAPSRARIANVQMLADREMPGHVQLVRAALTAGMVSPINVFPNRTYLLPMLHAAKFVGQAMIQGSACIRGALTASGLAAIAVNFHEPQPDLSDPDMAASLYLGQIINNSGVDLIKLYETASMCLKNRREARVTFPIQRPCFIPPPLPLSR